MEKIYLSKEPWCTPDLHYQVGIAYCGWTEKGVPVGLTEVYEAKGPKGPRYYSTPAECYILASHHLAIGAPRKDAETVKRVIVLR